MTALERAVLAIGLAAVFSFYFWEFRKGWAPLLAPLLLPCTIAVAYLAQRLGRKKMKRRFGPGFVLFLAAFVVILLIPPAYYAMVIVDRFNRWREKESPAHLSRAFPDSSSSPTCCFGFHNGRGAVDEQGEVGEHARSA